MLVLFGVNMDEAGVVGLLLQAWGLGVAAGASAVVLTFVYRRTR